MSTNRAIAEAMLGMTDRLFREQRTALEETMAEHIKTITQPWRPCAMVMPLLDGTFALVQGYIVPEFYISEARLGVGDAVNSGNARRVSNNIMCATQVDIFSTREAAEAAAALMQQDGAPNMLLHKADISISDLNKQGSLTPNEVRAFVKDLLR